jgi:prepilin-type processing-associated H-X9-DG protein
MPVFYTTGGAALGLITNANGASQTSLLAHNFLAPAMYGTVDTNFGTGGNSVPSTTQEQDCNSCHCGCIATGQTTCNCMSTVGQCSGMSAILLGGPHPGTNPTLFADGHVLNMSFTWANSQPDGQALWNWQNTTVYEIP